MCQKLCSGRGMVSVMLGALVIGLLGLGLTGCTPADPMPPASVSSEPPDDGWAEAQPADTGQTGSQATTEPGSAGTTEAGSGEVAMSSSTASLVPDADWVPLPIELPPPAFKGTPVPLKEPNVEKPRGAPREPFLAPAGTHNTALDTMVACSDPAPAGGEVDYVTDGAKEASDFGYLELHPGVQWVQIDLGRPTTIYAVLLWHNHAEAIVYRDVIVQVSDDPDFLTAQTVFNNDYDNSAGLGIGHDLGYVETAEGKLIDCGGVEGRYLRLYSNGNHIDGKNHYTEVEVFGRPAE